MLCQELGSVQGLKTTDCSSQTQQTLHCHIPPAPFHHCPSHGSALLLAFIPCKPSQ